MSDDLDTLRAQKTALMDLVAQLQDVLHAKQGQLAAARRAAAAWKAKAKEQYEVITYLDGVNDLWIDAEQRADAAEATVRELAGLLRNVLAWHNRSESSTMSLTTSESIRAALVRLDAQQEPTP